MTLARWQGTITDQAGNVLAGATVRVTDEATGALAALFSDRAGAVGQANPFTADADGYAAFHVAGGSYKIEATLSGYAPRVWRYLGVGTGAEHDFGAQFLFMGPYAAEETYSQNAVVTYDGVAYCSRVDDNTGNTPDSSPDEWTVFPTPTVEQVLTALGVTKITVSTADPSGGADGDLWFKVNP